MKSKIARADRLNARLSTIDGPARGIGRWTVCRATAACVGWLVAMTGSASAQFCPNPPSLSGVPVPCGVQLNWSGVSQAVSYSVSRAITPGGPATTIATVGSTEFIDTTGTPGVTYTYQVRATLLLSPTCLAGVTAWSSPVTAAAGTLPAPGQLTASDGCQQIVLTWNSVSGASSYQVQSSGSADFTTLIESTTVTTTTFTSTASSGTTYFRVRAVGGCGPGQWATTTGNRIGAAGPVGVLDVSDIESCGGVLLRWEPAARATSYRVVRIWNNTGVAIDTTNTWLLDTGAPRDVDLTYSVAGVNQCGPVSYSPGTARISTRRSSLRFIERPESVRTTPGQTVVLRARVDPVAGANARYQWMTWDGFVVDDGRITGATTRELTIRDVRQSDMQVYQLRVRRPGFVYYDEVSAAVIVDPFCPADHNGNGSVGVQDLFDFLADYFSQCF